MCHGTDKRREWQVIIFIPPCQSTEISKVRIPAMPHMPGFTPEEEEYRKHCVMGIVEKGAMVCQCLVLFVSNPSSPGPLCPFLIDPSPIIPAVHSSRKLRRELSQENSSQYCWVWNVTSAAAEKEEKSRIRFMALQQLYHLSIHPFLCHLIQLRVLVPTIQAEQPWCPFLHNNKVLLGSWETQSIQHILGLPQGLLPDSCVHNISQGASLLGAKTTWACSFQSRGAAWPQGPAGQLSSLCCDEE